MFYALPWLIVRGASAEARVVRHVHRKVRRSFGVGRVATNSTKFQMDELWVRSPAGVLRRPVRGPNALRSVDLQGAAAETPGFERPLPATVPKPGAGSGLAVVAGVAAALFLLVVCPWLVSEVARPAPGELSLGLERPELSASETRRIAQRRDTWSRRKALVAATASLKAVERLRLLRASVADTGAPLAVRLQAIRLLEDDGDRGASVLAASERTLAWGQKQIDSEVDVIEQKVRRGKVAFQEAVRLQVLRAKGEQIVALRLAVLRGLSDRSDPRAEAIAKEGLVESASSNPRLHQGWVVALSTAAPSPSTERALQIALADPSLLVAAHAGWVIAQGYPRSVPLIPLAFSRACEQARKQGGAPAALLSLARAMALSGQADRARKEFEGLAPATCEAIERVLNEVGC
jgi:hypothetical protein